MLTSSREEILLALKGLLSSNYDEGLKKWTDHPAPVKFQILQADNDFVLRISTDTLKQSDPLVYTSVQNTDLVKQLSGTALQVNLKGAHNQQTVQLLLEFKSHDDKEHFFLILKNATEELKSRFVPRSMSAPPPSYMSSTLPVMGLANRTSEIQVGGSEIDTQIKTLQKKIAEGDQKGASEAAANLAAKKVKLSVSADEIGDVPGIRSKFNLEVNVEDRLQSSGAKIRLSDVVPNMTIGKLKRIVFQLYDFPVAVQRWIIGRRIVPDYESLIECRVNSSTPVFLYLISAEKAGITRQEVSMQQEAMVQQMQQPQQVMMRQAPIPVPPRENQPPLVGQAPPRVPSRKTPRDVSPMSPTLSPTIPVPQKPTAEQVGWHCPQCTLINPPTIPGCRVCMGARPPDYDIPHPDAYIMDPDEKHKYDQLLQNDRLIADMNRRQEHEEEENRDTNYQALLMTDIVDIIGNTEAFECLICYSEVPEGEGVLLRECLHTFCKDCLKAHILHNREPVIMCPYNDGSYTCPEALLEREIKALIDPPDFLNYLQRGLSVAENQDPHSFHCKTPDCKGFCFYEDNINFFHCPVCGKENCLTCKAIHHGMNCKEYQDDLQRRAANDEAALMTKKALEKMIQSGEAMKCPQCNIIMLKKDGCDWIMCTMCKLEVCWVTRGPRWGSKGTGDTSGGCKCRVQGRRCHPNCQNCH